MSPRLSIVVPTRNGRPYIKDCLSALGDQVLDDVEVIVVDDASSDGSADAVLDLFPGVKLLTLRTQQGFASACNTGIRAATAGYVALLNNDTAADPLWAARLVEFLDNNSGAGFCASRVVFHSAPDVVDSCGDFYAVEGVAGKIGHLETARSFDTPCEVFGASASAAIYRRELLQELGGFDEDFYLVHEDTDLSFRARLMGHTCHFVPSAIVRHHVGGTLGYRSPAAEYHASRNQEFVFLKDMPAPLLIRYFAWHLLANGLQFAAHATRGRAGPWLRGKRDALLSVTEVLGKRTEIQRMARASPDAIDRVLMRGWSADAIRRGKLRRRRSPARAGG